MRKVHILTAPQFRRGQQVGFIGGTGTIRSYQPESEAWTYLVEMELKPKQTIDRIGYETMIWLPEADLFPLKEPCYRDLAIA